MKIITILGARPQFVKAGSVSREIARQRGNGKNIKEVIIHTGQHYDPNMSDIFFQEMKIPKPDYFLGIGGNSHGAMTGQMIEKIEEILIKEMPDWVMLYGDTNSTLAGAIAATKLHIKVAHVEAGLRSFNMSMPEEINRILTDRISSLLFCPTKTAVDNLRNEGVDFWGENKNKVVLSGDVMLDSALFYKKLSKKPNDISITNDFILCTIHRAENTNDPIALLSIVEALNEIAKRTQIVLPLHPRTKKCIQALNINTDNLTIIEPIGYLGMVWLLSNCSLVMTDSGGVQKEAYFFGVPCITLRNETEWVELVDCGANILVGTNKEKIISAFDNVKTNFCEWPEDSLLYGSGQASEVIINTLSSYDEA